MLKIVKEKSPLIRESVQKPELIEENTKIPLLASRVSPFIKGDLPFVKHYLNRKITFCTDSRGKRAMRVGGFSLKVI